MIGRKPPSEAEDEDVELKSFDDFELRLGDIMRGERATMGKSLLDVQRELRIKAAYIAAIENSDPSAFDTPGFIAGYVRSYARYLNMDPDEAFETFCLESGFSVSHGMSAQASGVKKALSDDRAPRKADPDPFASPNTPFAPVNDGLFSQIEPRAIGSSLILVALIAGIGYGGWSVLKEIQQVQVAPVDQTPVVLSDLDPLDRAVSGARDEDENAPARPRAEALDRLYRPQALDVPVLVARDAPISTLDPSTVGTFRAPSPPRVEPEPRIATVDPTGAAPAQIAALPVDPPAVPGPAIPQVVEGPAPAVRMIAAYTSWVRVRSADGSVIYEAVMEKGDVFEVPATEEPPMLRTGESGAIYFALADDCYGPAGGRGAITSNLPLHHQALAELYDPVDPSDDTALRRMFADLRDIDPTLLSGLPCKTN